MPGRTATPRDAMETFILSNVRPGTAVLDIGCGRGEFAAAIARRIPGASVDAVDADPWNVRHAVRRFGRSRRSAHLRCRRGAAEELSRMFGRNRFDCAVAYNSFHEFRDPVRALREMGAVLAPGGVLLIAELTPTAGEASDDCPRYSLRKIAELVRRAGFRLLATRARRGANLI
ncbi:MAG: class I SAM-dependent methyltransferase, partial [bacterium]|nr:class I SAM-dependent methyltransferase [bacterium]